VKKEKMKLTSDDNEGRMKEEGGKKERRTREKEGWMDWKEGKARRY